MPVLIGWDDFDVSMHSMLVRVKKVMVGMC